MMYRKIFFVRRLEEPPDADNVEGQMNQPNQPNHAKSLCLRLLVRLVANHINSVKYFEVQTPRITKCETEA